MVRRRNICGIKLSKLKGALEHCATNKDTRAVSVSSVHCYMLRLSVTSLIQFLFYFIFLYIYVKGLPIRPVTAVGLKHLQSLFA